MAVSYRGFVSYAHADKPAAQRLHRSLETFRTGEGRKTLGRFFRDDDEMAASSDLAQAIEEALAASEFLIVLCSPTAAQSRWVNAEVGHFIESGRRSQIIAVILDGEPNAADPARECLPEYLRQGTGAQDVEVLAVNLKQEGQRRSVAKIAARILEVPFDTLWDRQRRRQRRQVLGLTAAGICGLGLGIAAIVNGYRTAEQQRVNLAEENRRIAEALDEATAQGRLLAARAQEEDDPVTAQLIALEAFTVPHPKPESSFAAFRDLPLEARQEALAAAWIDQDHGDPDRSEAAAQIRQGLASAREIWARRFAPGAHEMALSADGTLVVHAAQSGTVTIERIGAPEDRIRLQTPGDVVQVALSLAADRAWVAAKEGLIGVDTSTGEQAVVARFSADDTLIRAAFSPTGSHAVIALESYEVLIADLEAQTATTVLSAERLPSFSFQNEAVIVAAGQTLTTLRLNDGVALADFSVGTDLDRVIRTATPAADLLTLVSKDDGVLILNNQTGAQLTFRAENAGSLASGFAIDPESGWTFFETGENHIQARQLPSSPEAAPQEEEKLFCGRRSADLALDSRHGHLAAVTEEGRICVWSLPDLTLKASFETGREIQHVRLNGDQIVTSHADGSVIAQRWRPQLAFTPLERCPEHLSELYFSPSGDALVGFGGLMGLCVWNMQTDPPAMHHAPGLMSNGPWLHHPPLGRGEQFLFVDRHGTVFEMETDTLAPRRSFTVPGAVFQGAGYVGLGEAVVGHTVDGRVFLWPDRADATVAPVRMQGQFETANVFWGSEVDRYLPVVGGPGAVHLFDASTGEEVLRTAFSTQLQIAAIETVAGAPHFIVTDRDGLAVDWPLSDLAALPEVVRDPNRFLSGVYNAALTSGAPVDVAFTVQGELVYLEAQTRTELLRVLPGDVGLAHIRSASLQSKLGFQPRKLAILGQVAFTDAPVAMIADLPVALRDPYDPLVYAAIDDPTADEEEPGTVEARQVLIDFENRRGEDLFFRIGAQAAPRCLTPQERARLRLAPDPPCWCATKSYPPVSDWIRSLGRDPFAAPRADGSVCSAAETEPWKELRIAFD